MKTISILCPTRERANRAFNYSRSIFLKATNPERVQLLFYVDSDDPQVEDYRRLFPASKLVRLYVGEPMSVSKSWNVLAGNCAGDILMMGNDDLLHITEGWDTELEKVSNQYPDDIYCAFFDDGINSGKHCAFPAISRKWYQTVGKFSPGIFEFLYNDTWVFDVARMLDRVHYIPDVLVKHNHWTVLKEKDATTKRHRDDNPGRKDRDKTLYENTLQSRKEDAHKLRKVMNA